MLKGAIKITFYMKQFVLSETEWPSLGLPAIKRESWGSSLVLYFPLNAASSGYQSGMPFTCLKRAIVCFPPQSPISKEIFENLSSFYLYICLSPNHSFISFLDLRSQLCTWLLSPACLKVSWRSTLENIILTW